MVVPSQPAESTMPSSQLNLPLTRSRTILSSVNNPFRSGLRRRVSRVLSRRRGEIYINEWINQQQRSRYGY